MFFALVCSKILTLSISEINSILIKKILKLTLPPLLMFPVFWIYRRITYLKQGARLGNSKNSNFLFDGQDSLFKSTLLETKLYGEYGCGKSTKWVLNNTDSKILAVDTSKHWVNEVLDDNKDNNIRLDIKYIDVGEVVFMGYPKSYNKQEVFSDYTNWIWEQSKKPDTVLIDGRFRVCCFLTSLKLADEGTRIIFDDYIGRPHYHIVEKFIDRKEICGRQCLFIVPKLDEIDLVGLDAEIINFRHVMN